LPSNQPGSQFWGTGSQLAELRENLDPIEARLFIQTLGTRLFGNTYDYSEVEFRGLNLNIKITVAATGEVIETTPWRHLMTEDGRGY
jgi:hypothetical protein